MATWQDPQSFATWLAIVSGFILTLVVSMIYFTQKYYQRLFKEQSKSITAKLHYQRQLVTDSIRIQEQERERVSLELHDNLLSKLNTVLFGLRTQTKAWSVPELLEECIHTAREISHDLRPPLIDQNSCLELIKKVLLPLENEYQIEVNALISPEFELNTTQKLHIFRITQEIISNILKYAQARHIQIDIRTNLNYFFLSISDDGIGFVPNKNNDGLGLKNIELRAQMLNGRFKYKNQLNEGTCFLLILPTSNSLQPSQIHS